MECEKCFKDISFEEYIDCDTFCKTCYKEDSSLAYRILESIENEVETLEENELWEFDEDEE